VASIKINGAFQCEISSRCRQNSFRERQLWEPINLLYVPSEVSCRESWLRCGLGLHAEVGDRVSHPMTACRAHLGAVQQEATE
jgi:hypothetical protein